MSETMLCHPYTLKFPRMKDKELTVFRRRCKDGKLRVPIVYRVLPDGQKQLIDGRHRLEFALENKIDWPMTEVSLDDADVWDYMMDCNGHRRHLTNKERRDLVLTSHEQKMSLRRIADALEVSHETVRKDLKSAKNKAKKKSGVNKLTPDRQNVSPPTVVGKDGREYPANGKLIPELAGAALSPKLIAKLEQETKPRQRSFLEHYKATGNDGGKAYHMLLNDRQPGDEPPPSRVHAKLVKWVQIEKLIKSVEAIPDVVADAYEGREKNVEEYHDCQAALTAFRRAWDRWVARLTFVPRGVA